MLSVPAPARAATRGCSHVDFTRALRILFLAPFLIAVLGAIDNGIHHIDWLRESVGMVQISVPLWIVALVQWLILHIYLSRPAETLATASASPKISPKIA